jgi:putative lipoprotein
VRARSRAHVVPLALLGALALSSPTRPARAADPDPDPWIAKDKALHFSFSAVIAGTSYAAGAALFDARGHALLAAGGVTLAVGAGKELLDLAGYGDPSWKDFAADVAGTIVGLAIAWSIDLLVRGVDDRTQPLFTAPRDAVRHASPLGLPARGLVLQF